MKKIIISAIILMFNTAGCYASHLYLEKEYQNQWCTARNGALEYTLNDNTRIDCLTKDYAIEFDFAQKWAESIGQSLYYALSTNKTAGVVLIMEHPEKDQKYLKRLNAVASKYNIKVWTMTPQDMPATYNCTDYQKNK